MTREMKLHVHLFHQNITAGTQIDMGARRGIVGTNVNAIADADADVHESAEGIILVYGRSATASRRPSILDLPVLVLILRAGDGRARRFGKTGRNETDGGKKKFGDGI